MFCPCKSSQWISVHVKWSSLSISFPPKSPRQTRRESPVRVTRRPPSNKYHISLSLLSFLSHAEWTIWLHQTTAASPLSVFNKVPLIAQCHVSARRRPTETPEETVTRQLKPAEAYFFFFFPLDRRKWKVRRWGRLLNCQGEIKDMKAFLSLLSIHPSICLCLSVWILFSDHMSRLHMHTTQNQSPGKSCHQSSGCDSRLSSLLLLCKTKQCVCVCVCVCMCVCYGFLQEK